MEFYRAELKKSPRAIEYLKGRGLTGEIAARFRIGYAPDDWQGLKAAFPDYERQGARGVRAWSSRTKASATTASATASCSRSSTRAAR